MTSDEEALIVRCRERVKKIVEADDVGYYANMYKSDVWGLLKLLDRLDRERVQADDFVVDR